MQELWHRQVLVANRCLVVQDLRLWRREQRQVWLSLSCWSVANNRRTPPTLRNAMQDMSELQIQEQRWQRWVLNVPEWSIQ